MFVVLQFIALGAAVLYSLNERKTGKVNSNLNKLMDKGFFYTARLIAKDGSTILFEDRKRQVAFVTSSAIRVFHYNEIERWEVESQGSSSTYLHIYTPLQAQNPFTFPINRENTDAFLLRLETSFNGPPA